MSEWRVIRASAKDPWRLFDDKGYCRAVFPDSDSLATFLALTMQEIDRLRAALATPEVYSGVVQEQVAREREAAIARAAAAEAKLAQAKQACHRLIEQNLCWGHAEAARQVLEAMEWVNENYLYRSRED